MHRVAWQEHFRKVVCWSSSAFQMQRAIQLRFSATKGQEPEVQVALV